MGVLDERVEEIRRNQEHGASWMVRRAIEGLVETAEELPAETTDQLLAGLFTAGRDLAGSRPGVGAIAGAVGRVLAAAHRAAHLSPDDLRRLVRAEAEGLISQRDRAKRSIAIQLRQRLTDALVVTHSASATVHEALVYARPERVTCTVTRPHEEGRRFADDLRAEGLDVDVVDDEEAPAALEHSSLLLIGADAVFCDGGLYNRAGTLRLAEAAHELGVPTVVAAETLKLVPIDTADAPPPEEGALFEIVPPDLIEEIVTEEGPCVGEGARPLVDRTPFLSEGYRLLRGEEP